MICGRGDVLIAPSPHIHRFAGESAVYCGHARQADDEAGTPRQRLGPLGRDAPVAVVRDDEVWSQLVPVAGDNAGTAERCSLFRFHFPPGIDNSGFVGWLATRLKRELGTGVFVICGVNSRRGGIYDYWGCPVALRDDVRRLIDSLRAEGIRRRA